MTGHDVVMTQFAALDEKDILKTKIKMHFCSAPPKSETDNEMALWLAKLAAANLRVAAIVGDNDIGKNFVSLQHCANPGVYFYTEGGMDTATPLVHAPGSPGHIANVLALRQECLRDAAVAISKCNAAKTELKQLDARISGVKAAMLLASKKVWWCHELPL